MVFLMKSLQVFHENRTRSFERRREEEVREGEAEKGDQHLDRDARTIDRSHPADGDSFAQESSVARFRRGLLLNYY